MTDYDVIVAMLARMDASEDGRKCPHEEYTPKGGPPPYGEYEPVTVDVDGDRVLLVPGGYSGFYSRLRFDKAGRLVGWGSYE